MIFWFNRGSNGDESVDWEHSNTNIIVEVAATNNTNSAKIGTESEINLGQN